MGGRDDTLRRNFLTVGAVAAAFLLVGTVGLMLVEKWGWFDALWMSFITLSTVGYSEVRGLDTGGRLVAIVVMLGGLIVIALLSASVTSLLVRRELLPMFRNEKARRRIDDLRGHTILCGAGETGRTVIEEFAHAGRQLVVIERDEEASTRLREAYPDLMIVAGDATRDEVLEEANIAHAHGLITTLTEDAANLFVVISARSLNADLCVVARAIDPHTQGKMYKAGATHVLSPKAIEGRRMAAMVLRPSVVNLLEVMRTGEGPPLNLEEVIIPAGSPFDGRSLRELEIPQRTGLIVIAIDPAGADRANLVFNPQSTTIVRAGDKLVVLGAQDRIDSLSALLGRE